jgi:hypothetical protein
MHKAELGYILGCDVMRHGLRPDGSSTEPSDRPISRVVALAYALDDAIAAICDSFWRAVIDGFAAYGESLYTPGLEFRSPGVAQTGREGDSTRIVHSTSESSDDNDTFVEYEDLTSLLESLRSGRVGQ